MPVIVPGAGTFAVPQDVAAVWRSLSTDEADVAETLLGYAAMLIRRAVPSVDAWLADGTLDPSGPQYVSVEMVRRRMMNPEGARTASVSIDDWQRSWTIDSERSVGGLTLTDDLLEWLRPAGVRVSGAFTIHPSGPARRACDAETPGWC